MRYINGKLFIFDKLVKKDFAIVDKKIILNNFNLNDTIIDLNGLTVLPGLVDLHIHTRNPGYEYKEDLSYLNQALLYGGFCNGLAQSNIKPLPININYLNYAQNILNKLDSKIIQVGRITNNNLTIVNKSYWSKVLYVTDDGQCVKDKTEMLKAIQFAKKYNTLLILHEQDYKIKGNLYSCNFAKDHNLKSFSEKYEANIVLRDLLLNKDYNAKMHIQHVSTLESLKIILKYKKIISNLTFEFTPHHLFLDNEAIKDHGFYKMNPPLTSKLNRLEFIKAFKNGLVDVIATDHAPHSNKEKDCNYKNALNGIIGLETAFAIINTIIKKYDINLKRLVDAMSIFPGRLINIDNSIFENNIANLTIVDLDCKWIFKQENIKSKAKNSPFINKEFIGKVKKVIIDGKLFNL